MHLCKSTITSGHFGIISCKLQENMTNENKKISLKICASLPYPLPNTSRDALPRSAYNGGTAILSNAV